jgi:hypothetical protein
MEMLLAHVPKSVLMGEESGALNSMSTKFGT